MVLVTHHRRARTTYIVSFADEQWEDIPELARQGIGIVDLMEVWDTWIGVQENRIAGVDVHLCFWARAVYITVEVHFE